MNLSKIIVTVAVVACVGSTFAQGFGGGGGQGRGGMRMMQGGRGFGGPAMLLQREDVQAELKLSDDQKSKLSSFREKQQSKMRETFQAAMQGGERPDPTKMQEIFAKMNEESNKELATILTADQSKRLRELSVQRAGSMAVIMPDVQKEIGISDAQKTRIQSLQKMQQEANQSLFEKMRDGELDRDQLREKMQGNQKALEDEVAKVLTEDQKTKLKALGGAPFTFKDEPRGGGRRRG